MEAVMLGMDANFEHSITTTKKLHGRRLTFIALGGLVHKRERDFVLEPVVVDLFALLTELFGHDSLGKQDSEHV